MKLKKPFTWCPLALALLAAGSVANATVTDSQLFSGKHGEFQQTSGNVVATYVANWGDPNNVRQINGDNLSHILFAFLNMCGPGQLPEHAAICADKPAFTLAEDANSIDKAFAAAFSDLKANYPHLKILPSVGGWGGSDPFAPMSLDKANRQIFIDAVVAYLKANSAFDGIDIDWEWPANIAEGDAYADLMIELRAAMDALGKETGREYLVTSAIATGESYISLVDYERAEPAMDLIFLMTYDFFGPWANNNIGHHTAISAHSANLVNGYGYGVENAVTNMLGLGMPAEKLVLGVAKYAKGWDSVTVNTKGTPFGGSSTSGFPKPKDPWDTAGIATYTRVAAEILGPDGQGRDGFQILFDEDCQCHYAWRETDRAFVGFDHPADVITKGELAVSQGLGGVFAWEYGQDNGDILNAMNRGVGNLDLLASDLSLWQPEATYVKGNRVVFNHKLYEAKWWTQGNEPGALHGPWQLINTASRPEWSAETVYLAGDQVTHNGTRYEAQWWTLDNQPGVPNGPWLAI
uniref:glycosyl hydrolase family 18 protein n=1 Tax=Thaumasiovibrio occultus TaxID=1891184 RepID=UPI000B34E5B7|nr:glycosyl hydrolase family 18 protein [Thaumasiovibrio occultus]